MSAYSSSSGVKRKRAAPPKKKTSSAPPPTSPPTTNNNIDWAERKMRCEEYDSTEVIAEVNTSAMEHILKVTEEIRSTPYNDQPIGRAGPSFLLDCAGAIVKSISDTPWGWYITNKENEQEPLLLFIQNNLYGGKHNYTDGQIRLKKIMLMKWKEQFTKELKESFGYDVSIVFSKNLFDSIQ